MIIEPTQDRELVESVLFHPAIFDSISEDGSPKQIPTARYLAGLVDGVCVGVLMFHVKSRHVAELHIQVLPEHRKEHAEKFAHGVVEWLWDKGFSKLNAQVPFCCENVKNFAERVGFEVEGINRRSWMKHGKLWDSWYLGIVRDD